MGVLKFSLKMLKKEYRKAMNYAFTLMFTISVCFIFFDIITNPYLKGIGQVTSGGSWNDVSMPVITMLAFVVIVFCCAMIVFANNFYLLNKLDEIAIMSMSGLNFIDLTLYLLYQTMVIILFVMPLGLLLGYLVSLLVHDIMYSQLAIHYSIYSVSLEAFADTFWSILAMLLSVLLYSSGFVYRNDIQVMLSTQTVNEREDKRIFKFPKAFYLGLYIFGIILMVFSTYYISVFIFPCLLGILGAGGIMTHVLPDIFTKLKRKKYINDKIKLISISNLSYSLKKSITLVSLYSISTASMTALLVSQQNDIKNFITVIIGFVVMIVLLLIGILYKYIGEAMDRKIFFFNLYKLGYVRKQLKQIIFNEVLLYYCMIILIPLIYMIIIIARCYIHQDISILLSIILLLAGIIPPLVVCYITYYNYKNIVFKVIEGGVHYE